MISHLKRYGRMLLLLAVALWCGAARRTMRAGTPARMVIVQSAKLGDMVCTTPMFRAFKTHYSESVLYVMGNRLNESLLAGNTRIDRYVVRPPGFFALARALRSLSLDGACLTSPDPEVLAALIATRVPLIISPGIEGGFSPYQTFTYRMLLRFVQVVPVHIGAYAPREYLRLLEPLGVTSDDTAKELWVSDVAQAAAMKILESVQSSALVVGIAPSVGNDIKVWPPERFGSVARHLVDQYGAAIIWIGGPADTAAIAAARAAAGDIQHTVDTGGKLSMEELKAVIASLDLFISVDTGPIYIAEAFGVPTIDIVGPMDENEQPPRGLLHRTVVPPRITPALHIMSAAAADREEAQRQALAITSEMVAKEADELIASEAFRGRPARC